LREPLGHVLLSDIDFFPGRPFLDFWRLHGSVVVHFQILGRCTEQVLRYFGFSGARRFAAHAFCDFWTRYRSAASQFRIFWRYTVRVPCIS